MPFVNMPTAVLNMPAPDWGRFAELAIQQIQHGGDIRAQAGKDMISQMDKSFEQISKIMQYNSPEAKAERRMKMVQTQFMEGLYNDVKLHPENYIMTAHGPVQKDPFTQAMKTTQLNNSITTGKINQRNLAKGEKADALTNDLDTFRKTFGNTDASKLPTAPTEAAPAGSPGSTSTTEAAPETAPASNQIPVAVDTTAPGGGGWHQSEDAQGKPYWYTNEGEYSDTQP